MTSKVMSDFKAGKFDKVYVVYNKFINAATQEVVTEQVLPIAVSAEKTSSDVNVDYIFEPGRQEILETLIPKSIKTQIFKAVWIP